MDDLASLSESKKPRIDLVGSAESCHQVSSNTGHGDAEIDTSKAFFKSLHWTADGTTLVASSSTNVIQTFALPADLLEPRKDAISLSSNFSLDLPEPSHVLASSPYFDLSTPYTQTALIACREHPIQLYSIASPPAPDSDIEHTQSPRRPTPLASYPLIRPQTEAYLTPTSLIWSTPGTHFTTGAANLVATFDVTRPGGPISRIHTIPSKRHISKGSGVGMRGTVAALATQPSSSESSPNGLVAAGTWTRWVGLYDLDRGALAAATWSLKGAVADDSGCGVVQTLWSPCGRYLVVNERKAAGLLVYDIRVTGKLLGWLAGRSGGTHQRLSCDVFAGSYADESFEVWGGTNRGEVVVWDTVGSAEGSVSGSWTWDAGQRAPVGSVAMHGSGSVVATCSGGWCMNDADSDSDSDSDSESESESENETHSDSDSDSEDGRRQGADSYPRAPGGTGNGDGIAYAPGARLAVWSIGTGKPDVVESAEEQR